DALDAPVAVGRLAHDLDLWVLLEGEPHQPPQLAYVIHQEDTDLLRACHHARPPARGTGGSGGCSVGAATSRRSTPGTISFSSRRLVTSCCASDSVSPRFLCLVSV